MRKSLPLPEYFSRIMLCLWDRGLGCQSVDTLCIIISKNIEFRRQVMVDRSVRA